jgi:hypothetical protein
MLIHAVEPLEADLARLKEAAPPGATIVNELPDRGGVELLFYWPTSAAGLAGQFAHLQQRMRNDGALWVVLPKKAHRAALGVDLAWDDMQAALTTDLVDVKVASFSDETYGTKFVIRRSARRQPDGG